MFENYRVFETTLAGRPLKVETGKMAQLSNGSCMVRYGDTSILCNVTASPKPREGVDFFPLSVDYEEKLYAVGRIPGSFMPGQSNKDRLGAKRFKQCIEKATATMREIRRKERVRLHWGLPQQTRLNISYDGYTPRMRKKSIHRHLLSHSIF